MLPQGSNLILFAVNCEIIIALLTIEKEGNSYVQVWKFEKMMLQNREMEQFVPIMILVLIYQGHLNLNNLGS